MWGESRSGARRRYTNGKRGGTKGKIFFLINQTQIRDLVKSCDARKDMSCHAPNDPSALQLQTFQEYGR